jgi:hypothetical protein
MKKSHIKCGFDLVTASGFKPETFSSVVRCSIQLSYAAIPFWECKDMKTALFYKYFLQYRNYSHL